MKHLLLVSLLLLSFNIQAQSDPISDIVVCDDDGDGFALFDLTVKDAEVAQGQDGAISYHETQVDAENNTNAVFAESYQNISNPQTIFTRFEDFDTGEVTVNSFDVVVNIPETNLQVSDFVLCETDDDGVAQFDLRNKRDEINSNIDEGFANLYETQNDAETGENQIDTNDLYTNTSNPQTIFVRVGTLPGDCFATTSFNLEVINTCTETTTIPDDNFEQYLINKGFDEVMDDQVFTQNIENLTYLRMTDEAVSGLTGIEDFTALEYLDIRDNTIEVLDVSNNLNLETLWASSNNLNAIDVTNNSALEILRLRDNNISSLDVSQNTNLIEVRPEFNPITNLDVSNNQLLELVDVASTNISNLDISNNPELRAVICNATQITSLDTSQNTNLTLVVASFNDITSFDFSNNPNLDRVIANNTLITNLDLSNNPLLYSVFIENNTELENINLKNGNNQNLVSALATQFVDFSGLSALETFCVDDVNSEFVDSISSTIDLDQVTFTDNCISGDSNQIIGNLLFDTDQNGCDATDLPLSNTMITSTDGSNTYSTFTQDDGSYLLYTLDGTLTTSVTASFDDSFSVNPASTTSTFDGFGNMDTADFCIEPDNSFNDLNISIIPTSEARPGFDASYTLVYRNVGTTVANGTIDFTFDDEKLTFLTASETPTAETASSLNFDYADLNPFESREIDLVFNILPPPTVNIDDVLVFTATISPTVDDATPEDNSFSLDQIVIGSFDPNDITVLEGAEIPVEDVDKFLHYVIRFQNTGTASAINVRVENTLDNGLDWNSLQLQSSSHQMRTEITNGNDIAFIFDDINLPDSTSDEEGSNGYIAYKIKPEDGTGIGDVFLNTASIFFDFNEPIQTNTVVTEVVENLSIAENNSKSFSIFPNPAENKLYISSIHSVSKATIYNQLGQIVLSKKETQQIDVSTLKTGLYFIQVSDDFGNEAIQKLVKK